MAEQPVRAFIALGSNLRSRWGGRRANLGEAVRRLGAVPGVAVLAVSEAIETPPVGPPGQGPYRNAAAAVDTTLPARALLDALLAIEHDMGRPPRGTRAVWGPRVIDLDLLLYGEAVIDQPGLTVPHPRMHERAFVLTPLRQIAPDARHPVLGRTVAELHAALPR